MKTPQNTDVQSREGVIVGGGWEHDELDAPCASVQIEVNGHRLTLIDDAVQGWNLAEFDGTHNPQDAFRQTFGAAYGNVAEFDFESLRDFRKTLERVGSERIADVYGGKAIVLWIYSATCEGK